jgi:uncharacterized membrane protein
MRNGLIMIILLTGPWLLSQALLRPLAGRPWRDAGAAGVVLFFLFTASGHVIFDQEMTQMLPPWAPLRLQLVWATGILELLIAALVAVPKTRRAGGIIGLSVLVLFFPANIYAAFEHVPFGGHADGPAYLWFRTPIQILAIAWVYLFAVRREATGAIK